MDRLMNGWSETQRTSPAGIARIRTGLCAQALCLLFGLCCALPVHAQQPSEPVDISPIDGDVYYIVNQLSGMQLDLNGNSTAAGDSILQQDRSFTNLSQRWALTRLASGYWAISNVANGLCLDSSNNSGTTWTVQNTCAPASVSQQWSMTAAKNGYVTLLNHGTGLVLDVSGASLAAGAQVDQSSVSASPGQSQQWLLRPVFFRGVDNALLEKQEAERVAGGYPWWQDAGHTGDVLQILKNHGVNMVRIRPTSVPPYNTYTATTCTGNGCYAETDATDLDLAKRAKQLGMAVELTLFFDGGSSAAIPGSWTSDALPQAEAALYTYVKAEVEAYRAAGVMPDMVTIGNEVDTGFFGSLGSPSGSNFGPFAALQKQGMQAVLDASSDPSAGLPLPAPIRCIHITPAWNLTNFFGLANSNSIPYDAVCQSYYPIYHGPLTTAQAATANPNGKPVEETVLTDAANALGKPIFLIEVGEHYESGFDSNDPWYPATPAGQRQFLIDVDGAMKGLPNNLGMGIEYWDAEGDNIPKSGGGYTNGDGQTDAIYTWNGLTLFDNADSAGGSKSTAPNYSAVLTGLDALGGKLDPTLDYKLVNVASGQVLETAGLPTASGIALNGGTDAGSPSLHQQWTIASNGDGYFQIANRNVASGEAAEVLDNSGSGTAGSAVLANAASAGSASQEWDVVTAGAGSYAIVNKASGQVLAATAAGAIQQQAPTSTSLDWITAANLTQQWKIVPAHITGATVAAALSFDPGTPASATYGAAIGTVKVDLVDTTGSAALSSAAAVTLTVAGPGGFSQSSTSSSSNGVATFDLSSVVVPSAGTYSLTAAAPGLASAQASLTATKAVLSVTAQNAARQYGAANPVLTYGLSGFVNGDTQAAVTGAPVLSTSATATSAPGNYAIAIQAGTLAAANYTFALAGGTLSITPASTATSLAPSATTVNPGQSVSLTATVTAAGTTAIPAGTVTFLSGTTVLGSAALTPAGVATYAAASLSPGLNTITASYAGDSDFNASTSQPATVAEPDFSLAGNQTSLTISRSGSGNVALTVTPVGGYKGTITMGCSTTMPGVTCSFNPASYAADGSNTALTGTVTVSASASAAMRLLPFFKHDRSQSLVAAALLGFFPGCSAMLLAAVRRKRSPGRPGNYRLLMLLTLLGGTMGLSGCSGGSSGAGSTPQPVTGTVAVTATDASKNISQSITLNITIQ